MSEASETARITIIVSDFAMADTTGKVNILGAGVGMLGYDPSAGVTNRFAVVAFVDVPGRITPVEASIEIMLLRDGTPVELPGPAGAQALRIGQAPTFEKPQVPAPVAVRDALESRHSMVLDFAAGLPLAPGGVYEFAVQVDGDEERRVTYPFAVHGGFSMPVVG